MDPYGRLAGTPGRSVLALSLRGIDTANAACAFDPTMVDATPCPPENVDRRSARALEDVLHTAP
jgi:hypothetical protein